MKNTTLCGKILHFVVNYSFCGTILHFCDTISHFVVLLWYICGIFVIYLWYFLLWDNWLNLRLWSQGRSQDLARGGGGQECYFSDLEICMLRNDMLWMAEPYALLVGFGGMLPRNIFIIVEFDAFRCIFGSYFVLKIFLNSVFLNIKYLF